MATKSTIQLGPIQVTKGSDTPTRMAIFLWGPATCGKTTLAATAPGDKLWLSLGDNEHVSIMNRKDVHVAKLYDLSLDDLFKQGQNDNPFGLDQVLTEHTNIETVILDSVTALAFRALQKSVKEGIGAGTDFRPTMMAPGQSAYGGRNAIVLEVLTGLMRVTAKHNVHFIATAHEADAVTRKEGNKDIIAYVTVMLGGQLVNNMSFRWSEIWHLHQESIGKQQRRLAFRPTRLRKPMKTRMFVDNGNPDFVLTYDAHKPDKGQMTIAKWWDDWAENGFAKLAVPK